MWTQEKWLVNSSPNGVGRPIAERFAYPLGVRGKPQGTTSRWSDRIAGEQPSEGDYVHHVRKVLAVNFKFHVELLYRRHPRPIWAEDVSYIDDHRLHIVRLDLRTRAWRAIAGQRNAVDDKLRLIFGAAYMRHSIAFIQLARLRIHQIRHRSSRSRADAALKELRSNLAEVFPAGPDRSTFLRL